MIIIVLSLSCYIMICHGFVVVRHQHQHHHDNNNNHHDVIHMRRTTTKGITSSFLVSFTTTVGSIIKKKQYQLMSSPKETAEISSNIKDQKTQTKQNDNYNVDDEEVVLVPDQFDDFSFIRKVSNDKNDKNIQNDDNYYDIAVSGITFQTDILSQKYYNAIISNPKFSTLLALKNDDSNNNDSNNNDTNKESDENMISLQNEIQKIVWIMTTKDTINAILKQNGMEISIKDDINNDKNPIYNLPIDLIRIRQITNNDDDNMIITPYMSYNEFLNVWKPGMIYDFIIRNVSCGMKELSMEEILDALDPNGIYHKQANDAGIALPTGKPTTSTKSSTTKSNNNIENNSNDILNSKNSNDDNSIETVGDLIDSYYDEYEMSIEKMVQYNKERATNTPMEVVNVNDTNNIVNIDKYKVIHVSQLYQWINDNENSASSSDVVTTDKTLRHIMNAFVNDGCLIVDISNDTLSLSLSSHIETTTMINDMWNITKTFFHRMKTNNKENDQTLPPPPLLHNANIIGSKHAKIGYVSYHNNNMQILETRKIRSNCSNQLQDDDDDISVPKDGLLINEKIILQHAFDYITKIGKYIIQIAVTASTTEAFRYDTKNNHIMNFHNVYQSSKLLVNELIDDGKELTTIVHNQKNPKQNTQQKNNNNNNNIKNKKPNTNININTNTNNINSNNKESSTCMSPQRLCRYSNEMDSDNNSTVDVTTNNNARQQQYREIFGAHVDSTFITAVPVAEVSGLEIYDEFNECWYRPEYIAKCHYDKHYNNTVNDDTTNDYPWYTRYIVYIPGELLQIVSRNEIVASVHRVVASAKTEQPRYSVPVLLRGRIGQKLDCKRYIGPCRYDSDNDINNNDITDSPLLQQCDQMTMDDIMNIIG